MSNRRACAVVKLEAVGQVTGKCASRAERQDVGHNRWTHEATRVFRKKSSRSSCTRTANCARRRRGFISSCTSTPWPKAFFFVLAGDAVRAPVRTADADGSRVAAADLLRPHILPVATAGHPAHLSASSSIRNGVVQRRHARPVPARLDCACVCGDAGDQPERVTARVDEGFFVRPADIAEAPQQTRAAGGQDSAVADSRDGAAAVQRLVR